MGRRKVATKEMYNKPGPPIWAIVLIVIVVVAVISFFVATIWQSGQIKPAEENVQETKPQVIWGHKVEDPEDVNGEESKAAQGEEILHEASVHAVAESEEAVGDDYFDDAIFFGDSITTGIPHYLESVYPDVAVVAERGINLHNVLTAEKIRTEAGSYKTLLDAAEEYGDRKKVYIMLGGNDLGFEEAVFVKGYSAFIKEVKAKYPNSTIYLQSITPVTETESQLENYPLSNNKDINHYNEIIMNLAVEEKVHYLDVAAVLKDKNGKLPESASPDGVHFVGEYYYKWFDYLKKHTVKGEG